MMGSNEQENSNSEVIQHFATISKNTHEEYRVELKSFRNRQYIDIRLWYEDENTDPPIYKPSRQGITIPIQSDFHIIDELLEALTQAKEWIEQNTDKKD